ncbi:MAG: phosphoheptose isomerase [Ferruginibacter sp.]|nr:phosphoheptose isomerase [Ferruginibacter sp.]
MTTQQHIFSEIENYLKESQLSIHNVDASRPWGGFFVIEESDAVKFIDLFFPTLDKSALLKGKLSPKILLVAPGKKLSWQYHFRRAEIWKLIRGEAGVVRSETDEEKELYQLSVNEIIQLKQGERHRLVGLNDWGIISEIWMHTDANHPSDEDDIVRLQDDFGRGK